MHLKKLKYCILQYFNSNDFFWHNVSKNLGKIMNKKDTLYSFIVLPVLISLAMCLIFAFLNSYGFKGSVVSSSQVIAPIDIASTFIAYVALIVSVATILITVGGIYFTYWFSKQKETILIETSKDLAKKIVSDEKARNDFFDALLKSLEDDDLRKIKNDFVNNLENVLQQKVQAATNDAKSTRVYRKKADKKSTLEQMSGE